MSKIVILGLNQKVLSLVERFSDDEVCVVDVKNFLRFPQYRDFSDELVQRFYQASLMRPLMDDDDFEHSKAFFQEIASQSAEIERQLKKDLLQTLRDQHVDIKMGHVHPLDPHHLSLNYLGHQEIIEFDQVYLNTGYREVGSLSDPLVFTLDELLKGEVLYQRVVIQAKTTRSLEMADMLNRLGCEVTLICDRQYFNQIDHLMFRDGIRQSLKEEGVCLLEKKEIETIHTDEKEVHLQLKSQSQLAFEIMDEPVVNELVCDILVVEGERLKNEIEELEAIDCFEDCVTYNHPLYLSPVYASVVFSEPNEYSRVIRCDAMNLTYFASRYQLEGGLEVTIDTQTLCLQSAHFFCSQALDLLDMVKFMNQHQLSLSDCELMSDNSIFSVLKQIRRMVS